MYIFKKQIVGSNLFAKTNLWFTIGFILTAALTFSEVARGRQYNFMMPPETSGMVLFHMEQHGQRKKDTMCFFMDLCLTYSLARLLICLHGLRLLCGT